MATALLICDVEEKEELENNRTTGESYTKLKRIMFSESQIKDRVPRMIWSIVLDSPLQSIVPRNQQSYNISEMAKFFNVDGKLCMQ